MFPCSADHEQDWQPYPVDPYSAICDDHTYWYEVCILKVSVGHMIYLIYYVVCVCVCVCIY